MTNQAAARIDRVLTHEFLPRSTLRAALRDAYLEQYQDDAAIDIYTSLWERLVTVHTLDTARELFDEVMSSLPRDQRSDVYPDGEC